MNRRGFFVACDEDRLHQRIAGMASWAAFSARWQARQGLPLLHAMDVQYLTPADFCNGCGRPLVSAEQRRVFRAYVQAAIEQVAAMEIQMGLARHAGLVSADFACIRCEGFVRNFGLRRDSLLGRAAVPPYDALNVSPSRPYGIPVTFETFPAY